MARTAGMPRRGTPQAKSARGRRRRAMILTAAAELFRRNGFHVTGIDDIGAAVGITGPGVYRHFESKQDLLAAIIDQSLQQHVEILAEVHRSGLGPQDALRSLIVTTAQTLVNSRDNAAIYFRESENLAPDKHAKLVRTQRALIADWVELLRAARPELSEEEAHVVVRVVSGLLNSVGMFHTTMSSERLAAAVADMALRAIFPGERS